MARPAVPLAVTLVLAACDHSPLDPLLDDAYTEAEVDYFLEIALGFEFGEASEVVRKWGRGVEFRVQGAPTAADRATLADVVSDINALTSTADLVEVATDPSVELYFAPVDTFAAILPSYREGNVGYFTVWWGPDQHLVRAVVLVASDVEQHVRDHLIREEMTQMLGMAKDSPRYPESIFQQSFTTVTEYAPIDEAVIEILYRPEIVVGMDRKEAREVAQGLRRGVVTAQPAVADAARLPARSGVEGSASGGHGWAR